MGVDVSKFIAGLHKGRERKIAAAVAAIDVAGEELIGDAQPLVPVKTGALQASGTTEPAVVEGTRITKVIGFNTNYAAEVHEVLTAHHDVGQAKYLETPMRAKASKIVQFIAGRVKAAE